ncbi:hypothetical protein [Loigolactobacillus jiayinensis]|uniref:hypothetical protein n=1 Tax=Loigolactobacillus jiayinensis TaxID=2486016 RepID=UPI000F76DB1F|nr:hypothetical protein [Loigolactobacillus jiayinensis]
MKVLTEATIRQLWRQHRLKDNYQVEANTILTPSARSFLSDHHIELTGVESHQVAVEQPIVSFDFDNIEPLSSVSTSTFFAFQHELKNMGNECLGVMANFPQCNLLVVRQLFFQLASIDQANIDQEIAIGSVSLSKQLELNTTSLGMLNYWVNRVLLELEETQICYLKLNNEMTQLKVTSFSEVYLMLVDELTTWLLQIQKKFLQGGVDNE